MLTATCKTIDVNALAKQLEADPSTEPVLMVCRSRHRRGMACRAFANRRRQNVAHVTGGKFPCKMTDLPVLQGHSGKGASSWQR